MGSIIGTVLIAGTMKLPMAQYRLYFTDDSVVTVLVSDLPPAMRSMLYFGYPAVIAGGIELAAEGFETMRQWERIVADVNANHRQLVSYTEVPPDAAQPYARRSLYRTAG